MTINILFEREDASALARLVPLRVAGRPLFRVEIDLIIVGLNSLLAWTHGGMAILRVRGRWRMASQSHRYHLHVSVDLHRPPI